MKFRLIAYLFGGFFIGHCPQFLSVIQRDCRSIVTSNRYFPVCHYDLNYSHCNNRLNNSVSYVSVLPILANL